MLSTKLHSAVVKVLLNQAKHIYVIRIIFIGLLWAVGLISLNATTAMADDFTITFEEPVAVPGNIKTQYCSNAASNQGVEFRHAASRFEPSVATFSGTHALKESGIGDVEPFRRPMVFSFTTGQSHVGVQVGLEVLHAFPVTAVLRAFDDPDPDEGTQLTPTSGPSVILGVGPVAITTPLTFSTPTGEPTIRRVEIEFVGPAGQSVQEIIDELTFSEIGPPCLIDNQPPSVAIFQPQTNTAIANPEVLLHFGVQDLVSGVARIRVSMLGAGSTELTSFFVCGGEEFPNTCPGFPSSLNVEAQFNTFLPAGTETIRVEATDFAGNAGQDQVDIDPVFPDSGYNLWVLGMEVTQGIQNQVQSSTISRQSFAPQFNLPLDIRLVAGKQTVVRVFPGVEDTSVPVVGARATLFCRKTLGSNPLLGEPCDGPSSADLFNPDVTVDPANGNDLTTLRLNPTLTWNFILPSEWTTPGDFRWLIAQVKAPNNLPECGSVASPCDDGANVFVLNIPTSGFAETAPLIIQPIFACVRRSSSESKEDCASNIISGTLANNTTDAMTIAQQFLWGEDWDSDGLLDPFFNNILPIADGPDGVKIETPIINDYIDGDLNAANGIMSRKRVEAYLNDICDEFIFDFFEIFTDPGELIAEAYPQNYKYLAFIPPPMGPAGLASGGHPCAMAKIDQRPVRISGFPNSIGAITPENDFCSNCADGSRFTIHYDEPNVAHEIIHTFGVEHAGCSHDFDGDGTADEEPGGGCDPAPDVFPCPHGGICISAAELDEPFGFNTHNFGVLPPRGGPTSSDPCFGTSPWHAHDVMSYGCSPVWISPHTYETIFNKLRNSFLLLPTVAEGPSSNSLQPALFVSGRIEQPGDLVTLNTIYQLPMDIVAPEGNGSHTLELQGSNGDVLSRRHFDPSSVYDSESGTSSQFFQLMSFAPDAARLVLMKDDVVLFERTRTANAPTLNVLRPVSGEVWSEGSQTIQWEAADLDDDPLVYTVQYSNDLGTTWKTFALNSTETTLEVDATQLAGSGNGQALIRVFASDGFNSVIAESAPFTVTNKSPHVRIVAPVDGTVFAPQGLISFVGAASDPDDGTLGDSAYSWNSDRDGNLGQGHELRITNLSPGEHTITLTATDKNGTSSQTSIVIVVLEAPNTQPVADAGPDQQVNVGDEVQLDGGSSFDPDGGPLSFSWRIVSAPAGAVGPATLQSSASDSPHFSVRIEGIYVIELVVRDGEVDSVLDQVIIKAVQAAELFAPGVHCVNFVDVQTGVSLGPVFEKDGFVFGSPGDLVVADFSPVGPGLLFSHDGVHIEWPASALMVQVTAGSWSGAPLDISAFNGDGTLAGTGQILPLDNVFTIGFNDKDIHIIEIIGGGDEGLLTEICIGILGNP